MAEPRVLARVVFPSGHDLDVVPLYIETNVDRGAGKLAKVEGEAVQAAALGGGQTSVRFGPDVDADAGAAPRRSAIVAPGRRVSFATYFNAFPASYWRRWTPVTQVALRVRVSGTGSVLVYRSNAKGSSQPVESFDIDSDVAQDVELTLPLTQFVDGGWYWFDLAADDHALTLHEADWSAVADSAPHGRVSIGITTFNRPDFCLDQLRTLGAAANVLDAIDTVYVVDQGTDRIREQPDFADATKQLAQQLEVIEQPNLGGSGGFSRAMDETVLAGRSDYVLLLDDDVVGEPESILRAATFADLCSRPTIVGGHMFSLYERSVLNAFGETVSPFEWWWGAAPVTERKHDFGRANLRHTPWLHRRVDVDYNGWWMCLIPTSTIRDIGLSIPVFLKWDDAEYGLRAREADVPTVSLPGVAVWHVPWDDKTDAVDWQAYYHIRNRLLTALLHSPFPRGGRVVAESMQTQVVHLLAMQYSTAVLRLRAIEDLLSGPDHLHRDLQRNLVAIRAERGKFSDATTYPGPASLPAIRPPRPRRSQHQPRAPRTPLELAVRAAHALGRHATRPVRASAKVHPEATVAHQDAQWWSLVGLDSALVSTADGAGVAWHLRDPRLLRDLLQRSTVLHARLAREWPRLREEYREAAADFTAPERWRQTFTAAP